MDEPVRSAIENVQSGRNASGRKAPVKAPSAPTNAPPAESKSTAKRKAALKDAPAAQPAAPSNPPASKVAEPKVRKGPQPLMFRYGKNPQTFADAIAERRAALRAAKDAYKAACVELAAAEKTRKQRFSEHHAAYRLLGAAIGDTPCHSDGNKAEIAAAQETVKTTKGVYAAADKDNGVALKAADKAKAAVEKAEENLKVILKAKDDAAAAAKAGA